MKSQCINVNNLEWQHDDNGDFSYFRKRLTPHVMGEKLGASLYKLMPGKKAFPYHFHHANEEAIFVLEGQGTLRINNEMKSITQGDYIVFPIGPDHAHQIINTSEKPLIFLCFSTMNHPDISEYPDSKKIGLSGGAAPGASAEKFILKAYYRKDNHVDYFDGEK
jgi:uncharacterized cupin superfamily protein